MNTNTLIQLATLISVAAALIGLLVSVRAYKRQVSAYFLLEYTKRFENAVQALPLRLWAAHLYPDEELPESSEDLRLQVFRCLTCLAQMHYFCRKGYIPKSAWKRVEFGFAQILRSPLFLREWKFLAPIFVADRVFCRYVEKMQQVSDGTQRFADATTNKSYEPTTQ